MKVNLFDLFESQVIWDIVISRLLDKVTSEPSGMEAIYDHNTPKLYLLYNCGAPEEVSTASGTEPICVAHAGLTHWQIGHPTTPTASVPKSRCRTDPPASRQLRSMSLCKLYSPLR